MKAMSKAKKTVLKTMAIEFICVFAAVFAIFCWDQRVDTGKIVLLTSLKPAFCLAAGATSLYFGISEFENLVHV